MRIDNGGFDKKTQLATPATGAGDTAASSGAGSKYDARDMAVVSELSSLLSGVSASYQSDRAARLNQLAQQYRAGAYKVDIAALGEALMAGAFEG
jgi:hypothetical protein